MNSLQEAIKHYLGRDIAPADLNFYSLIGLEPNAPIDKIKQHFAASAKLWNESDRKSHPELTKQVGALLKEAQRILLDEEKRHAYTQKLAGLNSSPAISPPDRSPAAVPIASARKATSHAGKATEHESYFPAEDPTLSFDEMAFVQEQNASPPLSLSPEARFTELIDSLNTDIASELSDAAETPIPPELSEFYSTITTPPDASDPLSASDSAPRNTSSSLLEGIGQAEAGSGEFGRSTIDDNANAVFGHSTSLSPARAVSNRRPNPRQKLVTGSLIALGGALIAGVGAYALYSGNGGTSPRVASTTSDPAAATPAPPPLPDPSDAFSMSPPLTVQQPEIDSAPTVPASMVRADTEPSDAPTNGSEMAPEPTSMTGPEPEVPPAASDSPPVDLQLWNERFQAMKAALEHKGFDEFKRLAAALPPPSGDPEIDAKRERLAQFGRFSETGYQAFERSRTELQPGDKLAIGNREIEIAANSSDSLELQSLSGKKSYPWSELPLGIALAILERALPDEEPESLAAQAAYLALYQAEHDLAQDHIDRLLEESQGQGSVREDFGQALSDTYPHPVSD